MRLQSWNCTVVPLTLVWSLKTSKAWSPRSLPQTCKMVVSWPHPVISLSLLAKLIRWLINHLPLQIFLLSANKPNLVIPIAMYTWLSTKWHKQWEFVAHIWIGAGETAGRTTVAHRWSFIYAIVPYSLLPSSVEMNPQHCLGSYIGIWNIPSSILRQTPGLFILELPTLTGSCSPNSNAGFFPPQHCYLRAFLYGDASCTMLWIPKF